MRTAHSPWLWWEEVGGERHCRYIYIYIFILLCDTNTNEGLTYATVRTHPSFSVGDHERHSVLAGHLSVQFLVEADYSSGTGNGEEA